MPILHWSPRSPYVRKVLVALHEKDLMKDIQIVRTVADPFMPPLDFLGINPLAKIPALELDEGQKPLIDSRVILEWADLTAPQMPHLFPADPQARLNALRHEALGTGLLEIGVTALIESRLRAPAQQDARVLQACQDKFQATLGLLEQEAAERAAVPFDAGHVSVGVALCYLDFRFDDLNWRQNRPQLTAWHAAFADRPSVRATAFSDEPIPSQATE